MISQGQSDTVSSIGFSLFHTVNVGDKSTVFDKMILSIFTARDYAADGQEELRQALNVEKNWRTAKNVILFIGDGLGMSTHTASRIYKGQLQGLPGEEEKLQWEKFPHSGLIKVYYTLKEYLF